MIRLELIKKQQHARAEAHKASEEAKKSTMAQLEVQHGATPPASPGLLMATGYLRSFEPLQ